MADTTKQTQTTASPAPAAPSAGAGNNSSAAQAPAAASASSLDSLLDAAFAEEPTQAGAEDETEAAEDTQPDLESADESDEEEASAESDEESDEEETEDEDEPESDEEDEDDDTPKGMENWPKAAVKRIKNQSAKIRDLNDRLRSAESVTIAPSMASPLADISTLEALDAKVNTSKAVRKWCQENADGGTVKLSNGQTVEKSAEEVAAILQRAEAEIEAAPDRRDFLHKRSQLKPWETAEKIAPGIFEKNKAANAFMVGVLKECPELTRLNDYEVLLAAAAKGYQIALEEQSGKAKWMRVELKDGKPVQPKAPKDQAKAKAATAVKAKPPVTPNSTKPALQAGSKPSMVDAIAKTKGNPEARLDAMLDAAFSAA